MVKLYFQILLTLMLLGSCKQDKLLGKSVVIPNELILVKDINEYYRNSTDSIQLKLFCLVDANCEICIEKINSWNSLVEEFLTLGVSTNIILQSSNPRLALKYFVNELTPNANYFVDSCNVYYQENGGLFNTDGVNPYILLLDNEKRIKMWGDPFYDRRTEENI